MSRFEAGMEGMVDTYIYESTSLLEQLDQIMMRAESNGDFDEEDINEIFRIMHTIKGSSAMMGLTNMSTLAHRIEDMFFIIREDKPIIESKQTLFELIFASSDLLKNEIDMLQDEDSEPTDFSEQLPKADCVIVAVGHSQNRAMSMMQLRVRRSSPSFREQIPLDS